MLRKLLSHAYWKAEAIVTPGLKSSQYAYYEKLKQLVPGKTWLDLGCGHQVFADWMTAEEAEVLAGCREVYGIDLDWAGLKAHRGISNKVFGDLCALPFRDASFEVVSANMVAEHLSEPVLVLREIERVLTPGGCFVFHTPNYLGWTIQIASHLPEGIKKPIIRVLEGRREEDVFRTFYRVNTEEDIRRAARDAALVPEDVLIVSSSAAMAMLGPLAWAELIYIRALTHPKRAKYRSNIVATLRKPN